MTRGITLGRGKRRADTPRQRGRADDGSAVDLPPGWLTWVAVTIPTLLGLALAHSTEGSDTSSLDATSVACQVTMLAVAVGFAAHQHATGDPRSGWLSAALTLPPVAFGLRAISIALGVSPSVPSGAAMLYFAGGALSMAAIVLSSGGRPAPQAPVAVGFLGGLATATASATVSIASPAAVNDTRIEVVALGAAAVCFIVLGLVAARAVLGFDGLGLWITGSLLGGGSTLALGAATSMVFPSSAPAGMLAALLHLLAWACFLVVAVRLLALVTHERDASLRTDAERARRHERELRQARATLHEVRATVAGLANATHLLAQPHTLRPDMRHRLVAMGDAEIARMQRLLSDDLRPPRVTDLGAALAPVVESVRARGLTVSLGSSIAHTHDRADDVVHIVHVLLDNAARHGAAPIEVGLEDRLGGLVVSVTDAGPGVSAELRDTLFDWGVSGAGSSGIGLHDARARARDMGGRLRLARQTPGCTRFELVLPGGGRTDR